MLGGSVSPTGVRGRSHGSEGDDGDAHVGCSLTAFRGSGCRGLSRPMGKVPTSKRSNTSPHMVHVVHDGPAVLPCGSSSDSVSMVGVRTTWPVESRRRSLNRKTKRIPKVHVRPLVPLCTHAHAHTNPNTLVLARHRSHMSASHRPPTNSSAHRRSTVPTRPSDPCPPRSGPRCRARPPCATRRWPTRSASCSPGW